MKVVNPKLAAPTSGSIDDLEYRCKVKKDKDTCIYIVQLEKHYEKLDK